MLYFTQSIVQFFFTLVFISIPIKLYIQLEFHLFELERKKSVEQSIRISITQNMRERFMHDYEMKSFR